MPAAALGGLMCAFLSIPNYTTPVSNPAHGVSQASTGRLRPPARGANEFMSGQARQFVTELWKVKVPWRRSSRITPKLHFVAAAERRSHGNSACYESDKAFCNGDYKRHSIGDTDRKHAASADDVSSTMHIGSYDGSTMVERR